MRLNFLKSFKRMPSFFSDVKKEMKKVAWPSKEETFKKTAVVIGVSLATAILLGGLDAIFTWVVRNVIIK
jgi:preprotein translocase subunit SecE